MASKMLSALLLLLLFYYMLYGSNASCLRAGPDLLTKNRFNLPPLPQLGEADEGHMTFLDSSEGHW